MKKIAVFTFLVWLIPQSSFAAGAYLVDDGGITDANQLQLESWYSHSNSGENLYVTNPAYQILPNTEFAIQETYSDMAETGNTLWPQIKYLWHKSENIASSATFGINYSSTDQEAYGKYIYSSTTVTANDYLDLHLYLGWQNWRHSFRNDKSIDFLNYGVGAELKLYEKLLLVPEIFQSNGTYKTGPARPATQLGLRYNAADHLIFDLIYGHNINGNNQDWMTFGITLGF